MIDIGQAGNNMRRRKFFGVLGELVIAGRTVLDILAGMGIRENDEITIKYMTSIGFRYDPILTFGKLPEQKDWVVLKWIGE